MFIEQCEFPNDFISIAGVPIILLVVADRLLQTIFESVNGRGT